MKNHRAVTTEICVGQPLPWDVFDAAGKLLLRRGNVIDTQRSLDRLLAEGLFMNEGGGANAAARARACPPPAAERKPSALEYLLDARRLIGPPTQDLDSVEDFPRRVQRIAELIDLACQASAEVAIASILLLQEESYVVRHHINTAIIANLLARAMSMPRELVRSLTAAALTMNIAKYEIQDKLHEVKGPLNERLRALIAAHPVHSGRRLRKLGVDDAYWLACVEQHHERENGSGYPRGLAGTDIEPGAKIIGLADRYCARVSIRSYRPTQAANVVLRNLYIENGAEIDPVVGAWLIRILGIYPPGTAVRLKNGEIAVVASPSDFPDYPNAYAVIGTSGIPLAVPSPRKTIREEHQIQDVLTPDKVNFGIRMSALWGDAARIG